MAGAAACGGGFDVSVSTWKAGSPDVSGTITNNTDSGCTDPKITLKFFDHNGALVQDFTFGAGELAAGASRKWTTHMIGLFGVDSEVGSTVTSAGASAECADQY